LTKQIKGKSEFIFYVALVHSSCNAALKAIENFPGVERKGE